MEKQNTQITEFIDYYLKSKNEPGYAVMLKGKWGSGKTWFINEKLKDLKENKLRYLYVSLYGMSSITEIEDEFFKQLHPVLSSKTMSLAGKIAKGLLKTTLKIDLNADGKNDGSISSTIPEINIPEYLKDTSDCVLIFDDLERSSMKIELVMGYINHYVEHQGYKVIILANEEEIIRKDEKEKITEDISYSRIKEKLIGKTFELLPDLNSALTDFIKKTENTSTKELFEKNSEQIKKLYISSESHNLRHLKQALWDFERFFDHLSSEVKNKEELIVELLKIHLIFTFEIRSGNLDPKEIKSIKSSILQKNYSKENGSPSNHEIIKSKYPELDVYDLLLEDSVWTEIFDKGIFDKNKIDESLKKTSHFMDQYTPSWVTLWHALILDENKFNETYQDVKSKLINKEYEDIGVLKHVVGLLLWLSSIEVIKYSSEIILIQAKLNVQAMKEKKILPPNIHGADKYFAKEFYSGLGFFGKDLPEWQEFSEYITKEMEDVTSDYHKDSALELLQTMKTDADLFYKRLILTNSPENHYYDSPILLNIDPDIFVNTLLDLTPSSRQTVFFVFAERYKHFKISLKPELPWLEAINERIELAISEILKPMTKYQINSMKDSHLKNAIESLKRL